ncbi:MAG: cobalt-precorrin-5B (C(1))-methyltransferase [Nitrospirae bacterium]|nr:cobalt-precorrin-5B (C(1))-methyltransferase [Nitrospirota bacterium]
MLRKKRLRSGYTTGACAAAAAKAATTLLLNNIIPPTHPSPSRGEGKGGGGIEIPFPDGSRHTFTIHNSEFITQNSQLIAQASVIKDAGDDPDVTNGAEIVAEAVMRNALCVMGSNKKKKNSEGILNNSSRITDHPSLIIKGGKGVGIATKPGLPVPIGEPAINPVPRKMIQEAVMEAISNLGGDRPGFTVMTRRGAAVESPWLVEGLSPTSSIEITISVTDGEKLAKKTLNSRLGIIGGISILGTTGIVRPISSEAWTATISSSMDVAKAMGHSEIALSAGRASEKAHMEKFNLPEESYVMMGDYLEFALIEAKKHGFKKIHLCAQWAKMLKIAMATPQTHVRHGALDTKKAVEFLNTIGIKISKEHRFNTAREIFDLIHSVIGNQQSTIFTKVCNAAKKYAEGISSGIPVVTHLVSYEGEIIAPMYPFGTGNE